jgi:peptidoglycan/LPS O-acetylase OafA/YrhL
VNVNFGLRTLLLIAATLLFLFAVFSNSSNQFDLMAWGLALFAFSFVIGDLGWDRRYGSGTSTANRP